LRYQHDRQVRIGSIGNERRRFGIDFDESFAAWLPKLSVTYIPSEVVRLGAVVQRAYNPGGATIRLDSGETDTFEAETLWAYELFGRASLLNGRVTARVNLFYNDISNAQRPQARTTFLSDGTGVLTTDIDNAPVAETSGAEIDIGWRPSRRISARAGVGLLRTRTLKTVDEADPILGREFQRSPLFSATLSLDWRPTEALRFSLQARHNDGYFSDDTNSEERRVPRGRVLNARAAWTSGALTLFAYARNLTEEFHLTYLFNRSLGTAVDPQQIGVGIDVRF
jgi:outer membrane receptor protein involved in Fe transport